MAILVYLSSATTSSADVKASRTAEQNIKITADKLECEQTKNVCIATGNAIIEKMNDPDKKTIHAEIITVYLEKIENKNSSSNKLQTEMGGGKKPKEFHVQGKVLISLKNSIIRGDRGIYNPETEIVEIYENVSVTSDRNEILGNYGWANLKTGDYKVLNSGGRVTAIIFQKDKN